MRCVGCKYLELSSPKPPQAHRHNGGFRNVYSSQWSNTLRLRKSFRELQRATSGIKIAKPRGRRHGSAPCEAAPLTGYPSTGVCKTGTSPKRLESPLKL